MSKGVQLSVIGLVQGVGYRAWAVQEARQRKLRGWVRNRLDGSVELLLLGEETEIEAMITACRRGPQLAEVTEVISRLAEDDGSVNFSDRPTD